LREIFKNGMTKRRMTWKRRGNETHRADAPDPRVHVAPGQLARVDEGAEDAEGWGR
jgi:hypothetical protein